MSLSRCWDYRLRCTVLSYGEGTPGSSERFQVSGFLQVCWRRLHQWDQKTFSNRSSEGGWTDHHLERQKRHVCVENHSDEVNGLGSVSVRYGVEGWTLKKSDRNRIESFEMWCWGLEKDARNFLETILYQYINIRRDWSGKRVNGEGGSDETTILRTRYQGKCRKFGTDSLGGQCRWFTSPRKTQKTMDGRHRWVEWL